MTVCNLAAGPCSPSRPDRFCPGLKRSKIRCPEIYSPVPGSALPGRDGLLRCLMTKGTIGGEVGKCGGNFVSMYLIYAFAFNWRGGGRYSGLQPSVV